MRLFRYLFLLILLPVASHAAAPTDFSMGFPVEPEPGLSLQRFEVSYDIYEAGFRHDFGDVRIFNANGYAVPMLLRSVPQGKPEAPVKKPTSLVLPVFTLESADEDGKRIDDYRMMVNTSENGTVVSVERTGENTRIKKNPTLLIDATQSNDPMSGLSLELKAPTSSLLSIDIDGSDDLSSWQFVSAGTLARMEHENGQILKDTVPVSGKKWKYYRVQGKGDFSVLGEIRGIFSAALLPQKEIWRWHTLSGEKVAQDTFEYRIPKGLPPVTLDLVKDDDVVLGIMILRPVQEVNWNETEKTRRKWNKNKRRAERQKVYETNWREIGKTSLYRMKIDDREIKSDPMSLPRDLEHFRIVMKGTPAELRVGWKPQEIIFMPQDAPPFMLAVGNPAVPPENLLAPMLTGQTDLKMGEATVGQARILAPEGSNLAQTEDKDEIDVNTIILWSVLGLGVLLLAGMAWSLVKGMKA